MAAERKSVWPWIALTLVALPALYVASFGPACWLESRSGGLYRAFNLGRFFDFAYRPLIWTADRAPSRFWRALDMYARFGMPENSFVVLPGSDPEDGRFVMNGYVSIYIERSTR